MNKKIYILITSDCVCVCVCVYMKGEIVFTELNFISIFFAVCLFFCSSGHVAAACVLC